MNQMRHSARHHPRLCRKTPSSARERAIFSPGKDGEAGDVCSIVDAAGCSQAEKGPLEARSSFPTQPRTTLGAAMGLVIILSLMSPFIAAVSGEVAGGSVLAERLIDLAGMDRGLCAVLGADGDLALQIVKRSNLLVHLRDSERSVVNAQRRLAEEAGIGINRLVIEQGPLPRLPYADNIVDVIITTRMQGDTMTQPPLSEVLRVLRPDGIAVIGAAEEGGTQMLRRWARGGNVGEVKIWQDDHGSWLRFAKPAMEGIDEWTHWEHRPDNNPLSTDEAIKAPYLTQFLAEPYYIAMPAITTAAGGRTFLATGHIAHHQREWEMINKLIARNGYNGIVLWERDLADGSLAHQSAFIATAEIFYLMEGDRCLLLDAQTGQEKGSIQIPGMEGQWKWMAMEDGVLFAMAGDEKGDAKVIKGNRNFGGWSWADLSAGYYQKPRVPWGFGTRLAALNLDGMECLWLHQEDTPIDSRALAMHNQKLYLYCPGTYLRGLDACTGEVLWTNRDPEMLRLIEEPGRKLVSTPGFRSACIAVATNEALIIQGQTRMNVIALSTETGELLWQKQKISNNPNVIVVDGLAILGVGGRSSHVAVDPATGEVIENLNFRKAACTRLTGCPDSLFVRGEGTLRYDRASKKVLVDGAIRPACNDGVIAANGMLYIGPWSCDCNLSLIGAMAKCSAGAFKFDHVATEAERLELGTGDLSVIVPLEVTEADWPTYRANNQRTASTAARLARPNTTDEASPPRSWGYTPEQPHVMAPPISAGGLVFVAGQDGKVRALDAKDGKLRWTFATAGPIKMPPTIWASRAYVGSGDGHVYALEAATGRLLWRFRAAPVERHIMVYGNLCSTWPVNTGVLVEDGVAYFGAGIIDSDGTYVYALDAKTGKIKWQNNSSGHLNPELRKGVSAQGCLTILGDQLLMAGGNQVSPARFEIETGRCLSQTFAQGNPKANHGKLVGVFLDEHAITGGRILYAFAENVANKDSFVVHSGRRSLPLSYGGIPPAWNDDVVALVNFRNGKLTCFDADNALRRVKEGFPKTDRPRPQRWRALADAFRKDEGVRWESNLGEQEFELVSLAVCPTSVVAVVKYQVRIRAHPQWFLVALNSRSGTPYWFWRYPLPSKPLPGGLLIDRDGRVIVTMLNGNVHSFGPQRPRQAQPDRADARRN